MDESGSPPPELKLDKDWPGLDDVGEGVDIDHGKLRGIARALREDVSALRGEGQGSLANLRAHTKVSADQTGTWETATYYGRNAMQGHEVITVKYEQLIAQLETLAGAIEKAVDNYEKGHTASGA